MWRSAIFVIPLFLFACGSDGETGPQGSTGADGLNAIAATADEVPGENCEHGGMRVSFGIDEGIVIRSTTMPGSPMPDQRAILHGVTSWRWRVVDNRLVLVEIGASQSAAQISAARIEPACTVASMAAGAASAWDAPSLPRPQIITPMPAAAAITSGKGRSKT